MGLIEVWRCGKTDESKAYPGDVVERTIVFYIKANVKGDTVYANGFKNNGELHELNTIFVAH